MNNFDIPIFKKTYELYKTLHQYRNAIPKQDRFTVLEKCENTTLQLLETIMTASGQKPAEKIYTLEQASVKLNMLRVFIRLLKDIKALDNKKYICLESMADEIGRMLGGWLRSIKTM